MSAKMSGKAEGAVSSVQSSEDMPRPAPWYTEDEMPEGFHFEAVEDADWDMGGDGKKCRARVRMKGCEQQAVARLRRQHYGRKRKWQHWAYCADHLYGRWIEDGKVMHWKLCKNVEA